jgi:hypothetical protein
MFVEGNSRYCGQVDAAANIRLSEPVQTSMRVNSSLLSDGTFCHCRTDLQVQESTSSSAVGEKLLEFQ